MFVLCCNFSLCCNGSFLYYEVRFIACFVLVFACYFIVFAMLRFPTSILHCSVCVMLYSPMLRCILPFTVLQYLEYIEY